MADKEKTPAAPVEETGAAPAETPKESFLSRLMSFVGALSVREKIIGGAALLFVLFVMLDLVMFRPLGRHLDNMQVTIQEKENLIPKRLMILKHRDRINAENEKLKGYLTPTELSQEEEIALFLREIEEVSKRGGLFISNINPVKVDSLGKSGNQLSVDLEGASNLATLKRFIKDLEESHPPIRVSAMNLRSQGVDSDEIRYRFQVIKLGLKEIR